MVTAEIQKVSMLIEVVGSDASSEPIARHLPAGKRSLERHSVGKPIRGGKDKKVTREPD